MVWIAITGAVHTIRINVLRVADVTACDNNNNNNSSFISTADNPQLIFYNKLSRTTAQIQSNTKNEL